MHRISAALLAALTSAVAPQALADAYDGLRPHRAVYDVSLQRASERAGITAMNGRIVYESTGSRCEGYSTQFRFVVEARTGRRTVTSDERTTTFESAGSDRLDFISASYLNGQKEREQRGSATNSSDGVMVELQKPAEESIELSPAIFPTKHVTSLIEAAQAGETLLSSAVFDGSGEDIAVVDTLAVIGAKKTVDKAFEGEDESVQAAFGTQKAWPVSVSYFDTGVTAGEGERTPQYQVSFKLFENGATRDLTMRFPDYALRARMKQIEFLPQGDC